MYDLTFKRERNAWNPNCNANQDLNKCNAKQAPQKFEVTNGMVESEISQNFLLVNMLSFDSMLPLDNMDSDGEEIHNSNSKDYNAIDQQWKMLWA